MHLDLRHIGREKLESRLPFVLELARNYVGVDPVTDPIPIRPVVHYMMGGIDTDIDAQTSLPGLYAAGECASRLSERSQSFGLKLIDRMPRFRSSCGQ